MILIPRSLKSDEGQQRYTLLKFTGQISASVSLIFTGQISAFVRLSFSGWLAHLSACLTAAKDAKTEGEIHPPQKIRSVVDD